MRPSTLALAAIAFAAAPAAGFHRQTSPVVQLTTTGDNALPRLPAFGNKLVVSLDTGGGRNVYRFSHGSGPGLMPLTGGSQLHDHPAANVGGSTVAWDVDCDLSQCPEAGHQIFVLNGTGPALQVTHDPTGTSQNPALNARGTKLAFESQGNLAGGNNGGAREIFLLTSVGITQASFGAGDSQNPVLTRSGRLLIYDSTSHPVTGADTGVSQIWLAPWGEAPFPITSGAGSSRRAAVTGNGRLVVFESTADLANGGANTGVSQIFAYEPRTGSFWRLTNQPGGCTGPSVDEVARDWRVTFTCGGRAFIHRVRADERSYVPMLDEGTTSQATAELGGYFMVVATTANLPDGGTTPGHQLYLLNLYKLPTLTTPSDAIQF